MGLVAMVGPAVGLCGDGVTLGIAVETTVGVVLTGLTVLGAEMGAAVV
jgi:hypothetical protein